MADNETMLQLRDLYNTNPSVFSSESKDFLQNRLANAGLSFDPNDQSDFSLSRTVLQFLGGTAQGFTTIPVGDDPRNDAEQIARNIGHLLGFVGYIPVPEAALARVGVLGVGRTAGILAKTVGVTRIKSAPMAVADIAMSGIKAMAKNHAALDAMKFLKPNSIGRDLIEGGLHLGFASAASAAPLWQLELEQRFEGFKGGVEAGVVFRGLGNLMAKGGKLDMGKTLNLADPKVAAGANAVARMVSASLYMGLPSSYRNDPMPIQVYEYVSGALFGGIEKPVYVREAHEFSKPYMKYHWTQRRLLDPKKLPNFERMSELAQEQVIADAELWVGKMMNNKSYSEVSSALAFEINANIEKLVKDGKITEAQAWEYQQAHQIRVEFGKEFEQFKAEGSTEADATSKASEVIRQNLAEAARVQEQHMNDGILKDVQEAVRGVLDSRDYLEASGRGELLKKFDEAGIGLEFNSPLSEAATTLNEAFPEKTAIAFQKELIDEVARHHKKKAGSIEGYDAFKQAIAAKYSTAEKPFAIEEDSITERLLRRTWTMTAQDMKVNQFTVNVKGEFGVLGERNANGVATAQYRPMTLLEEVSKRPVSSLKEVEVVRTLDNGAKITVAIPIHESSVNPIRVMVDAYQHMENGKPAMQMFVGGKKDNAELLFMKPVAVQLVRDGVVEYRFSASPVTKVISGGQSGADTAGLEVAQELKISTAGTMPPGFVRHNEKGGKYNDPDFAKRFKLSEGAPDPSIFRLRTIKNAQDADGTVWFGNPNSPGGRLTLGSAAQRGKPKPLINPDAAQLREWIEANNIRTLNVAGNREYTNPGISGKTKEILRAALKESESTTAGGLVEYKFNIGKELRTYTLSDKLAEIQKAVGDKETVTDTFEQNYQEWLKTYSGKSSGIAEPVLRKMYEHIYMNNIALLEKLNSGVKYEDMIRQEGVQKGSFLIKAADINKRMQVIHSGDYAVDKSLFKGIADLKDEKLRGVLTKVDAKDSKAVLKLRRMVDGVLENFQPETHLDGVMIVRGDVFEAIAKSLGQPLDTGGQKGTVSFTEPEKGMLLGKLLFHRASPEMEAHLKGYGLHYQMYDTAAKQIGMRPLLTERMSEEDGLLYYNKAGVEVSPTDAITDIPLSALRMNFSAGESGDIGDVGAKIQFSGNLSPELAKKWVDIVAKRSVDGDPVENGKIAEYQKLTNVDQRRGFIRNLDVNKLGIQEIYNILQGESVTDSPLYQKVVGEILKRDNIEIDGDILSEEAKYDVDALHKAKGVADKILSTGELTPLVMEFKLVKPYFQTLLRNYMVKRALKPTMKYSWKAKSYAYDPYLQVSNPIKEGEYLAAEGLRKKVIEVEGREMTIEKVWDELNAEGTSKERATILEEALEHFVMRIPADSASGVRVLKFRGFSGAKGYGVYLHPKDMIYLGGMDQDGDAVDVYTKVPDRQLHQEIKAYYKSKANQWDDPATGVMKPSSNASFLSQTEHPRVKSVVSAADPLTLLNVNKWAYSGNQLLAPGLLRGRRLVELQRLAARNDGYLYDAKGAPMARMKDPAELAEAIRDVINSAADAAKGDPMITRDALKGVLNGKAFHMMSGDLSALDTHPLMSGLAEMDNALKGKDRSGRAYRLPAVVDILDKAAVRTKDASHSYYRAGNLLSDLKMNTTFGRFLGGQFQEQKKALEVELAANPELRELAFRYGLKVSTEGLGKFIRNNKDKMSPAELADAVNDLLLNDIADLQTARELIRTGKLFVAAKGDKVAALKELRDIVVKVEEFKAADVERRAHLTTMRKRGVQHSVNPMSDVNASLLHRSVLDYVKTLTPEGKSYFDAYMVGSLFKQDAAFQDMIVPMDEAITAQKLAVEKIRETVGTPASVLRAEQLKLNRLSTERTEAIKDWWETNLTSLGYSLDTTSPDAIKNMVRGMNEIGQARLLKPTEADVRDANSVKGGSVSGVIARALPEATQMETGQEIANYTETFMSKLKEIGEGAEKISDPEIKRLASDVGQLLYHYPHLLKRFESFIEGSLSERGGVGVTPDVLTKQHLKLFMDKFKYKGRYWFELTEKEKAIELKRRHFFWDPESLEELHLRQDQAVVKHTAPVVTAENRIIMKPVRSMISHMGTIGEIWRHVHWAYNGASARSRQELEQSEESGLRLMRMLGADGEKLFGWASDIRQEKVRAETFDYKGNAAKALTEFTVWAKEHPTVHYTTPDGKRVLLDSFDALRKIQDVQNKWSDRVSRYMVNKEAEQKHIQYVKDGKGASTELIDVQKTFEQIFHIIREGKDFPNLGLNFFYRLHHQMILDRIVVSRKPDAATGEIKTTLLGDIKDGLTRSRTYRKLLQNKEFNTNGWLRYSDIGLLDTDTYFPHNGHAPKAFERFLADKILEMRAKGASDDKIVDMEMRYRQKANNGVSPDGGTSESKAALLEKYDTIDPKTFRLDVAKTHPSSVKHRGDDPLPGWDKSTEALVRYEQQILKGYHNMVGALTSQRTLDSFIKKAPLGVYTKPWAAFMRIYMRDNLGYPSTFPDEWLQNEAFKIKGNPYFWFTDQYMLNKYESINKRFGMGKSFRTTELRTSLKQVNLDLAKEKTPEVVAVLKKRKLEVLNQIEQAEQTKKDVLRKTAVLANLEAKYEMITLLAHTKTMANNLVGGHANTLVSTGRSFWWRAGDIAYLRKTVFPNAKGMDDIHRFAEKHGSGESYINDLMDVARTTGVEANFTEMVSTIKTELAKPKDQRDYTFLQNVGRSPFGQSVMNSSAWFMRTTERSLRNRSWMAHYLKARDVLDVSSFTFDAADPWLVKMANRGVAATQFLYNNAARPAFARTVLGRVFTRFKMYAWNSVKLRREILQDARSAGYMPGTDGHDRFSRMMLVDMFMVSMATMFPTSMFGANLPEPWNTMQNSSQFLLGSDEEKEKAFFGVLPYPLNGIQALAPPVMRIPNSVFAVMLTGEWDQFASRNVWTWFPFGRLAKSTALTLENPAMLVENMVGLPTHALAAQVKKQQKRPKKNPFLGGFLGGQ